MDCDYNHGVKYLHHDWFLQKRLTNGLILSTKPLFWTTNNWNEEMGCWVLGAGCWVLGAGCWVLVTGCWLLGAAAAAATATATAAATVTAAVATSSLFPLLIQLRPGLILFFAFNLAGLIDL